MSIRKINRKGKRGPGRPKTAEGARPILITLRLHEHEHERLKAKAQAAGLTVAAYLRDKGLA